MWLQKLAAELPITLSDGTVWLSIGQGLLIGAVCLVFGVWVARLVGLLSSDAPVGETLGVGLASGLMLLASWWAAVASGGRSSFSPVAVGFVIAIGLAVVRRARRRPGAEAEAVELLDAMAVEIPSAPSGRGRDLIVAAVGGGAFVVAVALLYGSTLTLSPRDGVQPLEFRDEAYYSILAADLAKTGTESLYSPSGFDQIEGLPTQTWYHWGEAWLAAAAITLFGADALDARHLIVLPLVLLAAAALTGTLVRRMTGSVSRGAFVLGGSSSLFLAPVALIPGGHFSAWAVGLIFGITLYGMAAVAVVLAMYHLVVMSDRKPTWALAAYVGSAAALILPAHAVIAVLALVGAASVWTIRIGQALVATHRLPQIAPVWRRAYVASGIMVLATVAWGLLTGHGVGANGSSPSVSPFNASWLEAVGITTLGAGAFMAIGFAWFAVRQNASIEAEVYVGVVVILVVGALAWGALLGDFNTFHLFYGGIAVFATPVAAVAIWSIWVRLRANIGRMRPALALLVLGCLQMELGVGLGVSRLLTFGTGGYPPVPVAALAAIRSLPSDAKLAYACQPTEEVAFWTAGLLGIDAHSGRRVIPMCFEAETFGELTGAEMSIDVPSPLYRWAPQRTVYPDSRTRPSAAMLLEFLKANGIDYIYEDRFHPNTLVADAIPVATSGAVRILRIP